MAPDAHFGKNNATTRAAKNAYSTSWDDYFTNIYIFLEGLNSSPQRHKHQLTEPGNPAAAASYPVARANANISGLATRYVFPPGLGNHWHWFYWP